MCIGFWSSVEEEFRVVNSTKTGSAHQKAAVEFVHFPLWRYNPDAEGKKLTLDSADKSDTVPFAYSPLVGGSSSARRHPQ